MELLLTKHYWNSISNTHSLSKAFKFPSNYTSSSRRVRRLLLDSLSSNVYSSSLFDQELMTMTRATTQRNFQATAHCPASVSRITVSHSTCLIRVPFKRTSNNLIAILILLFLFPVMPINLLCTNPPQKLQTWWNGKRSLNLSRLSISFTPNNGCNWNTNSSWTQLKKLKGIDYSQILLFSQKFQNCKQSALISMEQTLTRRVSLNQGGTLNSWLSLEATTIPILSLLQRKSC